MPRRAHRVLVHGNRGEAHVRAGVGRRDGARLDSGRDLGVLHNLEARPPARPALTSDASDQSLGFATRSIIWQNRCAPTVESTPWRLVTSGASLWDHAACSCGLSTYPLEAEADVPSTPTPSAPAVADCSMESSASGDWAAAAAAGRGARRLPRARRGVGPSLGRRETGRHRRRVRGRVRRRRRHRLHRLRRGLHRGADGRSDVPADGLRADGPRADGSEGAAPDGRRPDGAAHGSVEPTADAAETTPEATPVAQGPEAAAEAAAQTARRAARQRDGMVGEPSLVAQLHVTARETRQKVVLPREALAEPSRKPSRVRSAEASEREVLLLRALLGVVQIRAGRACASACATRRESGESTPRRTQPFCVTLGEEDRGGGGRGRAGSAPNPKKSGEKGLEENEQPRARLGGSSRIPGRAARGRAIERRGLPEGAASRVLEEGRRDRANSTASPSRLNSTASPSRLANARPRIDTPDPPDPRERKRGRGRISRERGGDALATRQKPPLDRPELHREALQNVSDLPAGHAGTLETREQRDVRGRAAHA